MDTDLSMKDIKVLRAIKNINENPDEFASTEAGETAANTRSIRKATEGLSPRQVKYRIKKSGKLDELVTKYDAEYYPEEQTHDPVSAELTTKGHEVLAEVEDTDHGEAIENLRERLDRLENAEVDGEIDATAISAEIESLRESVSEMESQVQQIADGLSAIQSSKYGAMDDEVAKDLDAVFTKTPVMMYLFDVLFNADVDYLAESGSYDQDELEQTRRAAFETLAVAANGGTDSAGGYNGDVAEGSDVESDAGDNESQEQVGEFDDPANSGATTEATDGGDSGQPGQSATEGSDSAGGADADGDHDSAMSLSQPDIAEDSDSE